MSKASFARYLHQIKNSKPVNWGLFSALAESYSINNEQLSKIFFWKKINNKRYKVTIINQSLFELLISRFPLLNITSRKIASIAGNSHNHKVSGSLLSLLAYQQVFPQLVLFAADGSYQTPHPLHKNLLVIENLENFLSLIKNPAALTQWLDEDWPCDIVYAQGKAIGNKLHQQFFLQYDKIRCLLDIDSGGFEIFKNIHQLVEQKVCSFVLSPYYLEKYIQYGYPINQQQRLDLDIQHYPPPLKEVVAIVRKYKQFAEQEILL
ncbi:MAG: hypothetical protein KZQ83_07745 [gamma proteobacterium symbiont of Taylorina sp.]|nr:hypothetical protein [gamma proteobacterium symbiont of Taylorina sp.]